MTSKNIMIKDKIKIRDDVVDDLEKRLDDLGNLRAVLINCYERDINKIISDIAWKFFSARGHYMNIEEILRELAVPK